MLNIKLVIFEMTKILTLILETSDSTYQKYAAGSEPMTRNDLHEKLIEALKENMPRFNNLLKGWEIQKPNSAFPYMRVILNISSVVGIPFTVVFDGQDRERIATHMKAMLNSLAHAGYPHE